MDDLYIGNTFRKTRDFFNAGVLADLTALSVDIKREATGAWLETTAEGTFHDLNILANKVSTGKYFVRITPDSAESLGVYLLYWTATYGTGGAAESFISGPDVLVIHAEADIPSLADNYVSLDAISKEYPKLFDLEIPARILRIGYLASRDVDAALNERFAVPIPRRSDGTYDQPLIDAAVALTVARVLIGKYPDEAELWEARGDKLIDGINKGRYRLTHEVTKEELGFQRPCPAAANASVAVELELNQDAVYSDIYRRTIIIAIDTAGAIDVATFKVSFDAGLTWAKTLQVTRDEWIMPDAGYGLSFRFRPLASTASLALADQWTIEAYPLSTNVTVTKGAIRTAELEL